MAVLTKLMRVALLVPVVLTIIAVVATNKKQGKQKRATIFPFFLIVFITLMIINSIINIPDIISQTATTLSKYALIAAITAIGMKTNLTKLLNVGYKPMLILVLEALWIAGIFIIYLKVF